MGSPSDNACPSQPVIEQFVLFGDSITEHSSSQERGYGFAPALQQGTQRLFYSIRCFYRFGLIQCTVMMAELKD